jgi:gamma-glutamylputrescine oxidase
VDDSRFVVRYFRKTATAASFSADARSIRPPIPATSPTPIRRQIAEVYPELAEVELTHAWGGYVGITMPRKPFMREVKPNVISIGGFSGHGVMLANFAGKLYAEAVSGNRDRLKLFEELKIPPFSRRRALRPALLYLALNWYALRDRI